MVRRRRTGRPLVLVVGVLAAACLLGLSTARAASVLPPPIDAGVARVHSVSGVLVLDPPYYNLSQYSHMSWTAFAATEAGDRKADVHYAVDWARAAADYRKALRQLRQTKTHPSAKDYEDLLRQYAVVTREVWVQDAATHTATVAFFNADPRTRRLVRVKYITLDFATGLPPTFDHTESWRVWEFAAQLRAAMEVTPGIKVADQRVARRAGLPCRRACVRAPARLVGLGGLATGLTLSVTVGVRSEERRRLQLSVPRARPARERAAAGRDLRRASGLPCAASSAASGRDHGPGSRRPRAVAARRRPRVGCAGLQARAFALAARVHVVDHPPAREREVGSGFCSSTAVDSRRWCRGRGRGWGSAMAGMVSQSESPRSTGRAGRRWSDA